MYSDITISNNYTQFPRVVDGPECKKVLPTNNRRVPRPVPWTYYRDNINQEITNRPQILKPRNVISLHTGTSDTTPSEDRFRHRGRWTLITTSQGYDVDDHGVQGAAPRQCELGVHWVHTLLKIMYTKASTRFTLHTTPYHKSPTLRILLPRPCVPSIRFLWVPCTSLKQKLIFFFFARTSPVVPEKSLTLGPLIYLSQC